MNSSARDSELQDKSDALKSPHGQAETPGGPGIDLLDNLDEVADTPPGGEELGFKSKEKRDEMMKVRMKNSKETYMKRRPKKEQLYYLYKLALNRRYL